MTDNDERPKGEGSQLCPLPPGTTDELLKVIIGHFVKDVSRGPNKRERFLLQVIAEQAIVVRGLEIALAATMRKIGGAP